MKRVSIILACLLSAVLALPAQAHGFGHGGGGYGGYGGHHGGGYGYRGGWGNNWVALISTGFDKKIAAYFTGLRGRMVAPSSQQPAGPGIQDRAAKFRPEVRAEMREAFLKAVVSEATYKAAVEILDAHASEIATQANLDELFKIIEAPKRDEGQDPAVVLRIFRRLFAKNRALTQDDRNLQKMFDLLAMPRSNEAVQPGLVIAINALRRAASIEKDPDFEKIRERNWENLKGKVPDSLLMKILTFTRAEMRQSEIPGVMTRLQGFSGQVVSPGIRVADEYFFEFDPQKFADAQKRFSHLLEELKRSLSEASASALLTSFRPGALPYLKRSIILSAKRSMP